MKTKPAAGMACAWIAAAWIGAVLPGDGQAGQGGPESRPGAQSQPAADAGGRFSLATVRPAVVAVQYVRAGKVAVTGSGFIVRADGVVYTNRHVITPPSAALPSDRILVGVPSRTDAKKLEYFPAEVIYADAEEEGADLAILKIAATVQYGAFAALKAAGQGASMGDDVAVLGYPAGLGESPSMSFTKGTISAAGVRFEGQEYYQTDAAVNVGNSGGPLINLEGQVLGIVTLRKPGAQNMGFALRVENPARMLGPLKVSIARAQPAAGPMLPKDVPGAAAEGPGGMAGVPAQARIRLDDWDLSRAKVTRRGRHIELDGGGREYQITTRKTLPEDFKLTLYLQVEGLEDAQDNSSGWGTSWRGMSVRMGTDKLDGFVTGGPGRKLWWSAQIMSFSVDEGACNHFAAGNSDEAVVLTITRKGATHTVTVDEKQVIEFVDPNPVRGRYPLSIGGVQSRMHLAGMTVQDLTGKASPSTQPAALQRLFQSPDWWDRNDAVVDLGALKPLPADLLLAGARDAHPCVRAQALWALRGAAGEARVTDAFTAALGDESPLVWREALEALLALKKVDVRHAEGLVKILGAKPGPLFEEKIASALAPMGALAARALVTLFRNRDTEVHTRAHNALLAIGSPAVPVLLVELGDPKPAHRLAILRVLAALGGKDAQVMARLVELFAREPERDVRRQLVETARHAHPFEAYGPLMVAAVRDEFAHVRGQGLAWFEAHPPCVGLAVADIAKMMEDESPDIRRRALRALAAGEVPQAAAAMKAALDDSDAACRHAAARGLMALKPDGRKLLGEQLRGGSARAKEAALEALADDSNAIPEAMVPDLLALLKHDDRRVRAQAARALAKVGRLSAPAVEAIVAALLDRDSGVAENLTLALRQAGPEASVAVANALRGCKSTGRQRQLLGYLEQIGSLPGAALAVVGDIVKEGPDLEIRREAVLLLARQNSRGAEEILQTALFDPNPGIVRQAMTALKASGAPVTKTILAAAESGDPKLRRGAMYPLTQLDQPTARTALLKGAKDPDPTVRQAAVIALSRLPREELSLDMVPCLIDGCFLSDPDQSGQAFTALGRFGEKAVPALIEAFRAGNENRRVVLGKMLMQTRSQAVVALMRTAVTDANAEVRERAMIVLAREADQAQPLIEPKDLMAIAAKALDDSEGAVRQAGLRAVSLLGMRIPDLKPQAQAALMKASESKDEALRREAVRQLLPYRQ